jgi:murein DD-endopeptidase MepM/ murein hydrolase activator NlpD
MIRQKKSGFKLVASASALALLAACTDGPMDVDLRGGMGGIDTSDAIKAAAAPRPEPDNRGVISYPSYQVAVSMRGDTVADVAARVGIGAAALASYNGLKSDDVLRAGEVLVLPSRVSEPSPSTGAISSGPIRPISDIDITELAGAALDRNEVPADANAATLGQGTAMQVLPQTGLEPIRHRVERGETAFTIARLYNVSIRSLADWNGLDADFTIREGQYLLVPVIPRAGETDRTDVYTPPVAVAETRVTTPAVTETVPITESVSETKTAEETPEQQTTSTAQETVSTPQTTTATQASGGRLGYPVQGEILKPYVKGVNEGVDIAATAGSDVRAAESGTVGAIVQDTNGVDIIVIKHTGNLLTVYTHVDNPTVVKGDRVSRGQVIGKVRAGSPSFVHFEVRLGSDSVDPMDYLK